jgi:hypothetical protein
MDSIYYFGIYAENSVNSCNDILDYEILLKVKIIDEKQLKVIDVMHYTNNFFQLNMDNLYLHFKSTTILPDSVVEFAKKSDNIFERMIKISHPNFKTPMYLNSSPLYFTYIKSKNILLDNLDKIKENIIKNNKILSE